MDLITQKVQGQPNIDHTTCQANLRPLMDAMELLTGRWKFVIIMALWFSGPMRFKELQRVVTGITAKVLTKELRDLEMNDIVSRTVLDTSPISVVYALTEHGKTLDKVILTLREWGLEHRQKIMQ